MKSVFENVINGGSYKLEAILHNIKAYHVSGDLTDEEKDELIEKARLGANVRNDIDLFTKVVELELRVKALEEGKTNESNPDEYKPYDKHKWYYRGDKCSENGESYICIAPEGEVCTWSPSGYPPYWEKI